MDLKKVSDTEVLITVTTVTEQRMSLDAVIERRAERQRNLDAHTGEYNRVKADLTAGIAMDDDLIAQFKKLGVVSDKDKKAAAEESK